MEDGNGDRMTITRSRRRHDEHGAVAVEFALVLLPLMLIIFGIIEFGFAFAQSASLAHGARQGARLGVVNIVTASTCGDVMGAARQAAQTVGMEKNDVAVTVDLGGTVCSVGAGTSTPSGGPAPCTGSTDANDMLEVTTTFETSIDIPPLPAWETTLTGEGAYRCEYN
jgi:Flp pilus assembly protein TadG